MNQYTNPDNPIGVFDSGLGGLTVLSPLLKHLPQEATVYLGDVARTPYGDRSPAEIRKFALQGLEFFKRKNVKALVIACNSASSVALPELHAQAPFPIFDVIAPGARMAARCSRSRAVGVMGTVATINSDTYLYELKSADINLSVHQVPCPRLAPLIEMTNISVPEYVTAVRDCLQTLPLHEIDTIILGCTHYPLIKNVIQAVAGDDMRMIDSGEATAEYLEQELTERGLLRKSDIRGVREYYLTSDGSESQTDSFKKQAERFLGMVVPQVTQISLGGTGAATSAAGVS